MAKISVYIKNPTLKQRLLIFKVNFLLWIASKIFTGEELIQERKDLLKQFFFDSKN